MTNPHLMDLEELPEGAEVIHRAPIETAAPVSTQQFDRYQGAVLPKPYGGLDTDLAGTQLPQPGPVYRLQVVPAPGQGQSNAAVQSHPDVNQAIVQSAAASATATQAQTTATVANSTANTAQAGVTALEATSFQGAYSALVSYSQGASVDSGGTIYVSLVNSNLNNTPASSPSDWVATGGSNTSVFLGAWSSATAYVIGNQVTFSGGYYIALANNTNSQPSTHPANWQLVSTTNTDLYLGAYNAGTAYVPGNFVSYTDGNFYVCISNSTGNAPAPTGSSFWTLLGSSAVLLGAYNAGTAYKTGMQVTNSGNIFVALQATTGNAPPTPPATNAFWQLVGPATLDNLADGTTKFGQTGSGLSYAPTSNPLTATDAGSNATVAIAAFTMRTSSKGDISDSSGSIVSLAYSSLMYIFYDDPTLAGGAVTYQATTTKSVALQGMGRFFVGSIQTPASGGNATSGNSDGGASAQIGMTALVPTTTFSGTYGTAGPTGGNGIATSSSPSLAETWTGMVPASNDLMAYSKVLSVRSSCTITGIGNALLKYSLNGGVGTTVIYNTSSTLASQVYTITLPSGQDLTQVQVFGQVNYSSGAGTHVNQLVSGISVTEIS